MNELHENSERRRFAQPISVPLLDSISNEPVLNAEEILDSKNISAFSKKNPKVCQEFSNKKSRRKHNCPYCDIFVNNFARHLERQHSDEFEVQEFLSLKKTDLRRKKIISKLRQEGDFSSGETIPVQGNCESNSNNSCELLPCTHCKGDLYKFFVVESLPTN